MVLNRWFVRLPTSGNETSGMKRLQFHTDMKISFNNANQKISIVLYCAFNDPIEIPTYLLCRDPFISSLAVHRFERVKKRWSEVKKEVPVIQRQSKALLEPDLHDRGKSTTTPEKPRPEPRILGKKKVDRHQYHYLHYKETR